MYALLPYESIACLVFMCLLLPMALFGIAACSDTCLTFCGVDESLGLYSLHLVSSLGCVLLRCGPLLLSIWPLSLFTLGLWDD